MATKSKAGKTKAKTATKKASAKKAPAKGYKGHIEGSRKGDVHKVFDTKGPEAAMELGIKLKLKPGTLKTWFGTWTRAKATKAKAA